MAPKRPPIVAKVERNTKGYDTDCFVQCIGLLLFFMFYADLTIYIAVDFILEKHYYWFSIQIVLYYNFIILIFWMLISLIFFTILTLIFTLICFGGERKDRWGDYKSFVSENMWNPFKISLANYWPFSPFLGLNYLYPIGYDIEYSKGIKESYRIRIYITVLHELIRSGGSIILQTYSLIEGYNSKDYLVIISLAINSVMFLKCKMLVIFWCHSLIDKNSINCCRKGVQYLIMVFEIAGMVASLIAMLRYNQIFALVVYLIIFIINVLYSMALAPKGIKDPELQMRNYCVTMHDYLSILGIRIFMVRRLDNFCLEIIQLFKVLGLIGVFIWIYIADELVEAIVAGGGNIILLLLLMIYALMSGKEPQKNEKIEAESSDTEEDSSKNHDNKEEVDKPKEEIKDRTNIRTIIEESKSEFEPNQQKTAVTNARNIDEEEDDV